MKFSTIHLKVLSILFWSALFIGCTSDRSVKNSSKPNTYEQLVSFFQDWRSFVKPTLQNGVPDYSKEAMALKHRELGDWKARLLSFDTTGWPIPQQVDWHLVLAEMNGFDFEQRVVRPWERDPAFYIWFYSSPSDVPEREGPNIFGAVDLQLLPLVMTDSLAVAMAQQLDLAPKVYEQAKINLTGKARDLWVTGTRSIKENVAELNDYADAVEKNYPGLAASARNASAATLDFHTWLEGKVAEKNEPSGVGKESYTWNLKNVHLLPLTWEEERIILERELYRSHSELRFTEHRNRKLPRLQKANDAAAYNKLITDGVNEFMAFMDTEEFITVKDYMKPALMAQVRPFVPSEGLRGFFDEVDHRDPMPMRAHMFHWIDKAAETAEPTESPIRRKPLLYNIFDSRAEGLATAMEELVRNAGLLQNRQRAKELIYIMLAQRCARGLGGLYQHSGEMTFEEATKYASKWVPWGLLPADGGTIQHEEQFYIQQPGYGSSYVVGKVLIDQLIAEYARQKEAAGLNFVVREFMDDLFHRGNIPVSLLYWEMTGDRSMLDKALN